MVGSVAAGAAVCALYLNCTTPGKLCTYEFGQVGADGTMVPRSVLPLLNNDTNLLNPGRKAASASTFFLPSANKLNGCCNPNVLSVISIDSGTEQQTTMLPPPEIKTTCGAHGCGLFQVAYDASNDTFPVVAWLQANAAPPPPGSKDNLERSAEPAVPETDPVVRLDPVTGKSELVRTITTMPAGHLAPKGQGLGAFDPKTQTLYFPGSAGDLVDDRVFSFGVSDGANDAPSVSTGPPKLDVNGMEFSAAADGGKGAPIVLGTSITPTFGPQPTALYQVVPQKPPIDTPWKKIYTFNESYWDNMGNTAISADGRYFHAMLRTMEVQQPGTTKVVTVDIVAGKEVSTVALQDPLQKIVDLVGC